MPESVRTYKDRLFVYIFGSPEHKAWTLSLYNAINGTHYDDADKISINTLREVLYLGMRNDVSFILGDAMSLYEQQSTYNPNMPVRMFFYAAKLYEKYLAMHDLTLYGRTLIHLPSPRLLVFYNGMEQCGDETELRLSSSFAQDSDPGIEVRVRMININYGRNMDLLQACRPLHDYSLFVDRMRHHISECGDRQKAVEMAIADMPEESVLRDFLREHKAEVSAMILTEYDEEKERKLLFSQGVEEGRAEGRAEGKMEGLEEGSLKAQAGAVRTVMENLHYSLENALNFFHMSEEQKEKLRPLIASMP